MRCGHGEWFEEAGVNEVLAPHMGPNYVPVTVSLEFADEVAIEPLERPIESLDRRVEETFPEVKKVFVEVESMIRSTR